MKQVKRMHTEGGGLTSGNDKEQTGEEQQLDDRGGCKFRLSHLVTDLPGTLVVHKTKTGVSSQIL